MPFLYTHLRFGHKCLNKLPDEIKKIVNENLTYFNYGTQGPNIFYYHSPFLKNKYKKIAEDIHNNSIINTLNDSKKLFNTSKYRDQILSYTLGYISHFLLDSYCNDYIRLSSEKLNISKNSIKSEIERYYLNKDKVKANEPLKEFKKVDISILKEILHVNQNDIKQSISNFLYYSKLLYIKNNNYTKIATKLLSFTKHKDYSNFFIYKDNNINLAQIIRTEKYFEIAVLHYERLINNYLMFIFNNEKLNLYYLNKFENNRNDVEIYKLDDEKKYIIKGFLD